MLVQVPPGLLLLHRVARQVRQLARLECGLVTAEELERRPGCKASQACGRWCAGSDAAAAALHPAAVCMCACCVCMVLVPVHAQQGQAACALHGCGRRERGARRATWAAPPPHLFPQTLQLLLLSYIHSGACTRFSAYACVLRSTTWLSRRRTTAYVPGACTSTHAHIGPTRRHNWPRFPGTMLLLWVAGMHGRAGRAASAPSLPRSRSAAGSNGAPCHQAAPSFSCSGSSGTASSARLQPLACAARPAGAACPSRGSSSQPLGLS